MPKLEVTFKSGAKIVFPVKTWKYEKSAAGQKITWTDCERGPRLVALDLDAVAAIVETERWTREDNS